MSSGTPWIGHDQAAHYLISRAQLMLLAAARKTPGDFDVAEAEFMAAASALENNPKEAASKVGTLAAKLVSAVMKDAVAGNSDLMDAYSEDSLTGDPNANYFVTLYMRLTLATTRDDPEARDLSLSSLTASLDNLATQPDVAVRAARALTMRLAMFESVALAKTIRDRD
jgi:hypothetical protein